MDLGPPALVADWNVFQVDECPSTNDLARDLAAWEAVVARRQTAGRGRFGRQWESGDGGLWLSAVVPAPIQDRRWRMLPLAAGFAVARSLRDRGLLGVRLRWPNDVMVGARKCAGILVDRFRGDRCVVGIGVNVNNDPSSSHPALSATATRLCELLAAPPSLESLGEAVLAYLRDGIGLILHEGPEALIRHLIPFWEAPRPVTVEIEGKAIEGDFLGVDAEGRVRILMSSGSEAVMEPEQIHLLRDRQENRDEFDTPVSTTSR